MLQHTPLLQDHDLVHPLDGHQVVGYDDDRPVLPESLDGFLYQRLRAPVEPRRRLIEDHEPSVAQEDSREGQELRLARREAAAGLQHRIQAPWHRREPLPESQLVNNLQEPLVGDLRVEERQVVSYGTVEKLHVLGDHADPPPQVLETGVTDIYATETHPAGSGVVEAHQQP